MNNSFDFSTIAYDTCAILPELYGVDIAFSDGTDEVVVFRQRGARSWFPLPAGGDTEAYRRRDGFLETQEVDDIVVILFEDDDPDYMTRALQLAFAAYPATTQVVVRGGLAEPERGVRRTYVKTYASHVHVPA